MNFKFQEPKFCSTGLSAEVSVLLIYLFGWIGGLIFLLVEKRNRSVRFHAMQSVLLSATVFALSLVGTILSFIPFISILIGISVAVVGLAVLVLSILIIVAKFQGRDLRVPVIEEIADALLEKL